MRTSEACNITNTSATCEVQVAMDGGEDVTARGLCWSTLISPTLADSKTTVGTDTGTFLNSITGLVRQTTYYVRAYATNKVGTAYSNEISFATCNITYCDTVTDADSNVYMAVQIGTQCWMAENLKVTHFRDGTPLLNITDNSQWTSNTSGAYCDYNNSASVGATYGKLYNWFAVNNSDNLCPSGWHVPEIDEWATLAIHLGGFYVAGGRLKEAGSLHWYSSKSYNFNEFDFTALPGGYRNYDGIFNNFRFYGYWWSSTMLDSGKAFCRYIDSGDRIVALDSYKNVGLSVRCVRD